MFTKTINVTTSTFGSARDTGKIAKTDAAHTWSCQLLLVKMGRREFWSDAVGVVWRGLLLGLLWSWKGTIEGDCVLSAPGMGGIILTFTPDVLWAKALRSVLPCVIPPCPRGSPRR